MEPKTTASALASWLESKQGASPPASAATAVALLAPATAAALLSRFLGGGDLWVSCRWDLGASCVVEGPGDYNVCQSPGVIKVVKGCSWPLGLG
jgi:hypothetical protein